MHYSGPRVDSPTPLAPDALVRPCPIDDVRAQAGPVAIGRLGQARALEALEFGVGMRYPDYHLFAMGPSGVAKHRTVQDVLSARAASEPVPPDDCYVRCFDDERRPRLLRVPAGRGLALRSAIRELVADLEVAVVATMATEAYRRRRAAIAQGLADAREAAVAALRELAATRGVAVLVTPNGFALSPLVDGAALTPEQFADRPESERQAFAAAVESIEPDLAGVMLQMPQWMRTLREQTRALDREVTRAAVDQLIAPLRAAWTEQPAVTQWLDALTEDLVAHAEEFVEDDGEAEADDGAVAAAAADGSDLRSRYAVNVLVDRTAARGAPVVYEDDPSVENLLGRVEQRVEADGVHPDVTAIVPGALHRVNGGYLVLDAAKLIAQSAAWDGLKRALFARQIRIESPGRSLGLGNVFTMEPEPIPLDVKCVLIGDRVHYEALCVLDPEFAQLFKVPVEFDGDVERTPETTAAYAALVDSIAADAGLRPLARAAVARVVEFGARLAEDAGRLSLQVQALSELVREADHDAAREGAATIDRGHVDAALAARRRRVGLLPERMLEALAAGRLRVETTGARVGQINALTVVERGDARFAAPARVTATARLGEGELVDIEREIHLGGPIHSKGVLILSGFLGGRYFTEGALRLRASLVFEQTYGGIEGDSASLAELCALLSAIAELPALQSIAITGSIDQHGGVQPIGAVNDKIEGFFDACVARGLDGTQGVIIPASNAHQLMLRQDVVDAAQAGRFRVWAVGHVDEALSIVFGRPAGVRGADGVFSPGSVNDRVEERLRAFGHTKV